MTDPAISVVIPTRDRAAVLSSVLDALEAQACAAAFEIVVVDNASTDDTRSLLEARSARDARYRTLFEPVLGRSVAMNAGAAAARGAVLVFTDDDVVVASDWIESYRRFFRAPPADTMLVAGGPIHPIAHDLGHWPAWLGEGGVRDLVLLDWGDVERELHPPEYLWGANMALTRESFDRIGAWDETIGRRGDERGTYEDVEYQDRVRHAGGTVWYCPRARVLHRLPDDRVTPTIVLSNAFARGRNEAWSDVPNAEPADAVLGSMLSRFGRWAVAAAAFRISGDATRFERVRRAAAASGASMERARTRYGGTGTARALSTAGWWMGRAIVRLAGGSGEGTLLRRSRSRSRSRRPARGRRA
jgi:glycosyltransferase involved in cell wall biosynthesis